MKPKRSEMKFFVGFIITCIALILFFRPYYAFLTKTVHISPFKIFAGLDSVKTIDNSVNLLILGIAGGEHDGPNLSDSIIIANYNFKKNRLITISIPRDIWSDTLRDRINSAYAYGEEKRRGGGLKLAKAEVGAIYGIPIPYGAVINFSGFDELIDYLGGIDVFVEQSFIDKEFPITGKENDLCGGDPEYKCRYETVSFEKGRRHMDGKTALKFVRSRHALGAEGSDFSRSKRQQQVMLAIKDKIVGIVKSLDLGKIKILYSSLDKVVSRDIMNQQVAIIAKEIIFKRHFYQKNFNLSQDAFKVPDYRLYDGKYVLVPNSGDFADIHAYIQCLLDKESEEACKSLIKE